MSVHLTGNQSVGLTRQHSRR